MFCTSSRHYNDSGCSTNPCLTLSQETHDYSFELLGKIGSIAAIRTALAFFLAREMAELEHVAAAEAKKEQEEEEEEEGQKKKAGKKRRVGVAHAKED